MRKRRPGLVELTIAAALVVAVGTAGCGRPSDGPVASDDPLAGFEENTYDGVDQRGLAALQELAIASWTPAVGTVDIDEATPAQPVSEAMWGQSEPQLWRVFSFPDQATLDAEMATLRSLVEADGFRLTPSANDRACCRYYEGPLGWADVESYVSSSDGLPTLSLDIRYSPDPLTDDLDSEEPGATDPSD